MHTNVFSYLDISYSETIYIISLRRSLEMLLYRYTYFNKSSESI